MQQQSSRRLNQLVGGKDTICRKHNQNREPKCNFIITTLSRSNKAVNDTKQFTIPRNSVFIAVNDCWATQEEVSQKAVVTGSGKAHVATHGGLGISDGNTSGAVTVSDERKTHRQPVIKAESLPQYNNKDSSIELKSSQRRSSNENCGISGNISGRICYATFSKGMYKPQHIYENDCIIQRQTTVSVRDCSPSVTKASTQPLLQSTGTLDSNDISGANNPPLYAVVNKNNKSKNKQANDLIAQVAGLKQQQSINDGNTKATINTTVTPTNNLFLSNKNSSNNNIKLLKTTNHPSSVSDHAPVSTSDTMGNMLQTILDGNCDEHKEQLHYLNQGLIANKIPLSLLSTSSQSFDPTITTTTITADMRSDSNAEHSIYAKVWKGPRKTSESKMYDI